jgi:hypothetical protein
VQVATCSEVCWLGCPGDTTGQEVCVGQWDHPFKAFMRQQYAAGNRLVGVYPEVSRVRHLFDGHGYTTSSDLQVRDRERERERERERLLEAGCLVAGPRWNLAAVLASPRLLTALPPLATPHLDFRDRLAAAAPPPANSTSEGAAVCGDGGGGVITSIRGLVDSAGSALE